MRESSFHQAVDDIKQWLDRLQARNTADSVFVEEIADINILLDYLIKDDEDRRHKDALIKDKEQRQSIDSLPKPIAYIDADQRYVFNAAEEALRQAHNKLAASRASLRTEIQKRQLVLQRLANAQEDERRRIAIELHDRTAQTLSALLLGFKILEEDGLPSSAREHLTHLKDLTNTLIDEMHFLAWELHPPDLNEWGLDSTLERYVDRWSQQHGIQADFHTSGLEGYRFPQHIETTIYRIVQELLTNVFLHAKASRVGVLVQRTAHQVETIVEDDGCGFDPEPVLNIDLTDSSQRLGLLGVQERVHMLNGELEIESTPGKGATVFIRIPIGATDIEREPRL